MVVLVGVDGSHGSRAALRWARRFSGLTSRRLCVVRTWEYPPTAVMPGGPTLLPRAEAEALVTAEVARFLAEELGEGAKGVVTLVERGSPDSAIFRAAAKCRADLVVVGHQGLGAVSSRLLGSVSRRVAQHASCPVAIVPCPLVDRDGPVVVGVDGSANAAAALRWAVSVARAEGTELVAVHAASVPPVELSFTAVEAVDSAGQALVEAEAQPAIDAGLSVRYVVRTLDARTLIRETAKAERARLVVVGARGAGPIASLVLGSTASYLAEHCEHPLVVVPAPTS